MSKSFLRRSIVLSLAVICASVAPALAQSPAAPATSDSVTPAEGETVYVLRNGRIVPIGDVSAKSTDGVVVVTSNRRIATAPLSPADRAKLAALAALAKPAGASTAAGSSPDAEPTPQDSATQPGDGGVSFGSRDRRVRVPYGVGVDELRRFLRDASGRGYYNPYADAFIGSGAIGVAPSQIVESYEALNRVQERAAAQRFNQDDMNRRQERLDSARQAMTRQGLELLHDGQYQRAVVALTAAADFDQGDASCRIHLAQARLALGHYEDAARTLRRALQLQPTLAYMDLKLVSNYADPRTFGAHVDELAQAVAAAPATGEVQFLLGYLEFQRGNFDRAHAAFVVAAKELGKDDLTQTYLDLTKPSGSPARDTTVRTSPKRGNEAAVGQRSTHK